MTRIRKQVGIPEGALAEEVQRFIAERSRLYSPPIINTLITELRKQLTAGVRAGERISDLRARVRRVLVDQAPDRVNKIVRTEVIGGLNRGSLAAYNRSPLVEKKTWLTSRDDRVRPTKAGHFNHQAADGQTVPKGDPFIVSGEQLQHPGDPSGSAGNIIRCRCAMKPVLVQR